MVSYAQLHSQQRDVRTVLILVVVDNGLVHFILTQVRSALCLNPYCSGRWSRTLLISKITMPLCVLILIVVDNGLVLVDDCDIIKRDLMS